MPRAPVHPSLKTSNTFTVSLTKALWDRLDSYRRSHTRVRPSTGAVEPISIGRAMTDALDALLAAPEDSAKRTRDAELAIIHMGRAFPEMLNRAVVISFVLPDDTYERTYDYAQRYKLRMVTVFRRALFLLTLTGYEDPNNEAYMAAMADAYIDEHVSPLSVRNARRRAAYRAKKEHDLKLDQLRRAAHKGQVQLTPDQFRAVNNPDAPAAPRAPVNVDTSWMDTFGAKNEPDGERNDS